MLNNRKETLRSKGLKVTPTRIAILTLFSEECKLIDVEYVMNARNIKNIDRVTTYRTLTSFEKAGIIKRADLRKDSVQYELAENHHHHIVCTRCGTLEHFENSEVEGLSKIILRTSYKFKKIQEHVFELYGTCNSCNSKV